MRFLQRVEDINTGNILEHFSKVIFSPRTEYPGLLVLNYSSNCSFEGLLYASVVECFCVNI